MTQGALLGRYALSIGAYRLDATRRKDDRSDNYYKPAPLLKTNSFEAARHDASRQGSEFPAFDVYGHQGRVVRLTNEKPRAISPRSVDDPAHILMRRFCPNTR